MQILSVEHNRITVLKIIDNIEEKLDLILNEKDKVINEKVKEINEKYLVINENVKELRELKEMISGLLLIGKMDGETALKLLRKR